MNTNNLSNKQYKQLLESIEKLIDKRLIIEENKILLKQYGIYDIVYAPINEDHTWNNEDGEDLAELKFIMGRLRYVIPSLMKTLIKKRMKKAVQLCVRGAKAAYKLGKENDEICKNLFYALLFFAIGYGGNALKEKYNSNPTIPGTQIEYKDSTLVVKQSDDSLVVVKQNDSENAPEIKVVKKEEQKHSKSILVWVEEMQSQGRIVTVNPPLQADLQVFALPIHPLQKGEQKVEITDISDEMVAAIAEVETFVDHLYDTKNRTKKLTIKDIMNPKADITIGYGHAVKSIAERKKLFGKTITKQQGLKIFKKDLSEFIMITRNAVKKLPYYDKVNISQGFFDFLVSCSMNMGSGNLYGAGGHPMSEFWNRINNIRYNQPSKIQEDMDYALAKINTQNTGSASQGGLKIRRRAEYWIAKQPYGTIKPEIYHLVKK